ncbi:hypothetical protein PV08_08305 [Exophiala spinifera]|uniref:Uncharacterized protein n=1 Tax=Exophiala spinifera TaxID=91928 RepID=A0A0D2B2I0_9EURO|nr:uncharacterized protein PV08_08305 [Exophiala spinifera]KIW13118.1 hypothetical protein PV08_08305 [Exophiala spinifera]
MAAAEPSHAHFDDLFAFWVGGDYGYTGFQSQGAAPLPGSPTYQSDSFTAQITPPPQELRRRQDSNVQVSTVPGDYQGLSSLGSLCGYVTQDVHAPLYCDEGLFCFTDGRFLQCCSSTAASTTTTQWVYTLVSTGRDVGGTSTTISTDSDLTPLTSTYGVSCGSQITTCYNYNDTASCTGSDSCTTGGALLCTNTNFPFCASVYAPSTYIETVSTGATASYVYKTSQIGLSYRCDTTEYGLWYTNAGYFPSVTTTFPVSATSDGVDFTPSTVPYSRTQPSRQASSAGPATPTSASPSAGLSAFRDVPRSIIWTISFWLVMAFLNILLYFLYEYLYSEP